MGAERRGFFFGRAGPLTAIVGEPGLRAFHKFADSHTGCLHHRGISPPLRKETSSMACCLSGKSSIATHLPSLTDSKPTVQSWSLDDRLSVCMSFSYAILPNPRTCRD